MLESMWTVPEVWGHLRRFCASDSPWQRGWLLCPAKLPERSRSRMNDVTRKALPVKKQPADSLQDLASLTASGCSQSAADTALVGLTWTHPLGQACGCHILKQGPSWATTWLLAEPQEDTPIVLGGMRLVKVWVQLCSLSLLFYPL